MNLKTFILFQTILNIVNSYNILALYTLKIKSHFTFSNNIIKSISDGHNITMINPFINGTKQNINYIYFENILLSEKNITNKKVYIDKFVEKENNILYSLFSNKTILNIIFNNTYDLILTEKTERLYVMFLPFIKILNIPMILTKSGEDKNYINDNDIRNDFLYFYPKLFFSSNWININITNGLNFSDYLDFSNYTRYEPGFIIEKKYNYLTFINTHKSIYTEIKSPYHIEIGGINILNYTLDKLNYNLNNFIEESKYEVILFSMGSSVNETTISHEFLKIIFKTFSQIKQSVIFKFNSILLPNYNISNNVLVMNWVPQKELLNHEKVKGFITHGGISSMYEGIFFKVPMIVFPIYLDQFKNSEIIQQKEIGIKLDSTNFTEIDLYNSINDILYTDKFQKNINILSKLFTTRQTSIKEDINFNINYIIKNYVNNKNLFL